MPGLSESEILGATLVGCATTGGVATGGVGNAGFAGTPVVVAAPVVGGTADGAPVVGVTVDAVPAVDVATGGATTDGATTDGATTDGATTGGATTGGTTGGATCACVFNETVALASAAIPTNTASRVAPDMAMFSRALNSLSAFDIVDATGGAYRPNASLLGATTAAIAAESFGAESIGATNTAFLAVLITARALRSNNWPITLGKKLAIAFPATALDANGVTI